jgi:hypothetical protein
MVIRPLAPVLALLAISASVPAQEPKQAPPATSELIEQLGDASYKTRKAAEDKLRELGDAAKSALQKAADEHEDPEVRWRARRLLQGSGAGDGSLRARRLQPAPLRTREPDLDRMFESMFEQLEQQFGVDIPRRSFFQDEFFRDLQRQMQDAFQGLDRGGFARGESWQMNVGPDGVRVEVKKKTEDGKTESKVYEAPDLDTFRQKYPEIAERFPGSGHGFTLRLDQPHPWQREPLQMRPWVIRPDRKAEVVPPETGREGPRLGIMVRESISDDLREFLGLEEGVGLQVDQVVDGSLAEKLGLETGDIVLEVAGRRVGTPADVRSALAEVKAGGKVTVRINRKGASKELSAEMPEPKKVEESTELRPRSKPETKDEAKKESGGTIR